MYLKVIRKPDTACRNRGEYNGSGETESHISGYNSLPLILSFAFISACGKDNDDKGNDNIVPTFESFESSSLS